MPARAKRANHGNKVKVSVSIDPDLCEWVESHARVGGRFGSFSHAVEQGLAALRDAEAKADARKRS